MKVLGRPLATQALFDGRLLRELGSSKAGKAALETLAKRRTSLCEAKSRHYAPIELQTNLQTNCAAQHGTGHHK